MSNFQAKVVSVFDKEEQQKQNNFSSCKNFEEFIEKSIKQLRDSAVAFENQKELDSVTLNEQQLGDWEDQVGNLESLFKMFCVLKGQKKKKSRIMENVCARVYGKHLLQRSFEAWKRHQQFEKYLSLKEEQADVFYNRNTLTKIMRGWQDTVIVENKLIVKNNTLRRTENELQKSQKEFDATIKSLEILLQQKLLTLRHEEIQLAQLTQKQAILMPNHFD